MALHLSGGFDSSSGAGATVVELEDFEGHLMASLSKLWLKRLVVCGVALER